MASMRGCRLLRPVLVGALGMGAVAVATTTSSAAGGRTDQPPASTTTSPAQPGVSVDPVDAVDLADLADLADLVDQFVDFYAGQAIDVRFPACSPPDASGVFACYGLGDGGTVSADGRHSPNGTATFVIATPATTTSTAVTTAVVFGDGTHVVDVDVAPGRYRATATDLCSWSRYADATASGEPLGQGFVAEGPAIVDLLDTDGAFVSERCREWVAYAAPPATETAFGPGVFVVGADITPGVYVAPGGDLCRWARLGSFSGAIEDQLGDGYLAGGQRVEILATDVGFESNECGDWTLATDGGDTAPATSIDDGVHLVGEGIVPGRYTTTVPVDGFCAWDRLSGLGGTIEESLGYGVAAGDDVLVVDIAEDDLAFQTDGCGTWTPYVPPVSPATSFGDGVFVVGSDIAAGRYESTGGTADCYWARLTSFGGSFDEIIENATEVPTDVTILESDVGFVTTRCGTWTLAGTPRGVRRSASPTTMATTILATNAADPSKEFFDFMASQGIDVTLVACGPLDVAGGDVICYGRDGSGATVAAMGSLDGATWTFTLLVGTPGPGPITDGVYDVGTALQPGRYVAARPTDACAWERTGAAGPASGEASAGPVIVDVLEDDVEFASSGCGTWTPYTPPGNVLTSFPDGYYVVGSDVAPGQYRAPGGPECSWARVFSFSGDYEDQLGGSYLATVGPIVDIGADDRGFLSSGCGHWQPYVPGEPGSAVTSFGDGTYQVGTDIEPGRYFTSSADGCSWYRLGDFRWEGSLGNSWGYDTAMVDVLETDAGFAAEGCGAWEPFRPPDEPITTFTDGHFVVGSQIVPGRYVSVGGNDADCFWHRVTDFTGAFDADTEVVLGGARAAEILATDGGFITVGCGTWTLESESAAN